MESSTSTAPLLQWAEVENPPYSIKISRGDILWLKPKSACCVTASFAYLDMEDGCFDHPALILHSDPQQSTATILLFTSLNNTLLEDKYPHNPYFRHHHLPIYPAPAHPDTGLQLFLEGGMELRRESYLKTEWRYEVPWTWLNRYDQTGRILRLHPFSLWDLVERHLCTPFKYETPPPTPPASHAETTNTKSQLRPDCNDAGAASGTSTFDTEEDELQQNSSRKEGHNSVEDSSTGYCDTEDETVRVNPLPLWTHDERILLSEMEKEKPSLGKGDAVKLI